MPRVVAGGCRVDGLANTRITQQVLADQQNSGVAGQFKIQGKNDRTAHSAHGR